MHVACICKSISAHTQRSRATALFSAMASSSASSNEASAMASSSSSSNEAYRVAQYMFTKSKLPSRYAIKKQKDRVSSEPVLCIARALGSACSQCDSQAWLTAMPSQVWHSAKPSQALALVKMELERVEVPVPANFPGIYALRGLTGMCSMKSEHEEVNFRDWTSCGGVTSGNQCCTA